LPPQLSFDLVGLRGLAPQLLFISLGREPFQLPQGKFNMRLTAAMQWRGRRALVGGGAARCCNRLIGLSLLAILAPAAALAQAPQPSSPPAPDPSPQARSPQSPTPPPPSPQQLQRAKLNQDTLIIAASRPGATYLAMANDLSAAIGTGGSTRLLPLAGDGGLGNLQDLLLLRGIDMAIVPGNALAHAKATNAFGSALVQRVAYVAMLYGEEVHVVAGQAISAIGDLRGKRVAVPSRDGAAQFTVGDIFRRLDIAIESVPLEPADAIEGVRSGAVEAAVLVGGKPLTQMSSLAKDGSVRLLTLSSPALPSDSYAPAVLLAEDYPALIPPGSLVETIAVSAVLVAGKGGDESARRVARHTPAVLDAIAKLAVSQRHPKWRDVNLGAVLPGWSRLDAAEKWLTQAFAQRREVLQDQLDEFLRAGNPVKASHLSVPRRKKLLDDFEAWARKSVSGELDPK
jgi:TRAP-type uncharacterized transport system substrate-binding protein